MPNIPQNWLWYDAVQCLLLLGLCGGFIWLSIRTISQGEDIAALKVMVGNHYKHRFDQIAKHLGIEWQDEAEDKKN